jgi:hypothetical protein
MNDNLCVAVLGHRNSGKSLTWNTLFGRRVSTGRRMRRLFLTPTQYVEVFLVSGSSEERHLYVEEKQRGQVRFWRRAEARWPGNLT